jgi:hypothetical protein
MKEKLDISKFPWHLVKKITFHNITHQVMVLFRSGFELEMRPPDNDQWDEMLREAALKLDKDKQFYAA